MSVVDASDEFNDEVSIDESLDIDNIAWPASTIMVAKDVVNNSLLRLFDKYMEKKGAPLWSPSTTSPDENDDDEDDELGSDDEIVDVHFRKCGVAADTSTLKRLFEKLDESVEDTVDMYLRKYPHFGIITTKEDFTLLKYEKGDFHAEHIECTGLDDTSEGASRRLCVIVFISDPPADGVVFEFLYQGVRVQAERGAMMIFPSCPLHPNRIIAVEDGALIYTINYLL